MKFIASENSQIGVDEIWGLLKKYYLFFVYIIDIQKSQVLFRFWTEKVTQDLFRWIWSLLHHYGRAFFVGFLYANYAAVLYNSPYRSIDLLPKTPWHDFVETEENSAYHLHIRLNLFNFLALLGSGCFLSDDWALTSTL